MGGSSAVGKGGDSERGRFFFFLRSKKTNYNVSAPKPPRAGLASTSTPEVITFSFGYILIQHVMTVERGQNRPPRAEGGRADNTPWRFHTDKNVSFLFQ